MAQAYLNQKKLDAEAKQLQHSATNFAKQTQSWLNLVEAFSSALKEIGDAENWARSIEGDMRTIATALEYSYKGKQPMRLFVLITFYAYNIELIIKICIKNIINAFISATQEVQGTSTS